MDAGLFIYFPRDPGHNIYFKVFDGQDIYFKTCHPPPPESTVRSLKKGTSFSHSQIVPIAMLHGLWPSYLTKKITVISNIKFN